MPCGIVVADPSRGEVVAIFTRSDELAGAEFVGADLTGARFVETDLTGVVMRGV